MSGLESPIPKRRGVKLRIGLLILGESATSTMDMTKCRKRHGLVMQNIGCAPKELVDLGNASEKDGNVFTHNAVGHQRTSRRDY